MQKIEYIDVEKLSVHPQNPRKIDEKQFEILCDSIRNNTEYFETRPILCNPQMIIFAGNMRFLAAKKIGLKQVPVAIMDIPEHKQKELMIRDNRQNGVWDFDMLANNFETKELTDLGFEKKELIGFGGATDLEEGLMGIENKYEVVVAAKDETDQKKIYDALLAQGYEVRVLTL